MLIIYDSKMIESTNVANQAQVMPKSHNSVDSFGCLLPGTAWSCKTEKAGLNVSKWCLRATINCETVIICKGFF